MGLWHFATVLERRRRKSESEAVEERRRTGEEEEAENVSRGCCSERNGNLNVLIYTLNLLTYLAFGAVAFAAIESDTEHKKRQSLRDFLHDFQRQHQSCLKRQFGLQLLFISQQNTY